MKRRRADDTGPSSSQIAESNNTLRLLQGRHNRWMAADANGGWQTASGDNTATNSSAVRSNAASASHAAALSQVLEGTRNAPSSNGVVSLPASGSQQERPASTSIPTPRPVSSSGPALVQYESPLVSATGPPTPATNARKSVDAMAHQPSLPSPASSDNSPTFAAQALRRNTPSVSHSRNSMSTITAQRSIANSPVAAHQPSPLQQQSMPRQALIPGHPPPTPPAHQQQGVPLHQHQGVPLQQQQGVPLQQQQGVPLQQQQGVLLQQQQGVLLQQQQGVPFQQHQGVPFQQHRAHSHHQHSMPSGVHIQPTSAQRPSQHLRTPSAVPSNAGLLVQLRASRIPDELLLKRLATKEAQMRQAGQISPTDSGRIALLRDAVLRQDWFYQVLSQVFCLRYLDAGSLPHSLTDINNKCWEYLDTLICSNDTLDRGLVEFFAHFPESIMSIYSTDGRDVYEFRLQSVKECLIKLPANWDRVIDGCKRMSAPPLVQDLSEVLCLKTPVLQSTAFRAIARMLYGASDLDSRGVQAIEKLHLIDQETYLAHNYRRNVHEMQQAYGVFTTVFKAWKGHLQKYQSSPQFPEFQPPQQAIEYFKQRPQNIAPGQQPFQRIAQRQRVIQHQQMQMGQVSQQRFLQAQGGRSSPQSGRVGQMPPQLAALASLGTQLQASRPPLQTPAVPPTPQKAARLVPEAHENPRAQPTNPDWMRSGVHQAHLRSPDLGPIEHQPDAPRLYRHTLGFSVPPTGLKKSMPMQEISFNVSKTTAERIAKTDTPPSGGKNRVRHIAEGSLLYRLRCSILPQGGFASESAWVTADNVWPEDLYFEINGNRLETRRKLHHGRYLPIDLTSLIRVGENKLKTCRTRARNDLKSQEVALAVEVIGVMSHEAIQKGLGRISAAESLCAIQKSLAGADGGDGELAVTSSALTIKLFDPYSGCKIFDIPVRGASCLHRDCFDLETFLQMCKRQHPGWPTVVDCWRCPLCRGDVRPQTLVVDDFLVNVRHDLEKQGLLDTRAIVVDADGVWRPKPEETTGVRSASLEREERGSVPRPTSAAPREVIEID